MRILFNVVNNEMYFVVWIQISFEARGFVIWKSSWRVYALLPALINAR